jgi:hypothetical protein
MQAHNTFLTKYMPNWQNMDIHDFRVQAAFNSINAAVKRNATYAYSENKSRENVRKSWMKFIISVKFEEINNWSDWRDVVMDLCNQMNSKYPTVWFDDFRVAHSQKSLSVYWKYIYCLDVVKGEIECRPIVMPLDRIIQVKAGLRTSEIIPWGKISDFDQYERQMKLIANKLNLNFSELIDWEIYNFSS